MFPHNVEMYSYYCDIDHKIYKCEYSNDNIVIKEISEDEALFKVFNYRKPKKSLFSWEFKPEHFISGNIKDQKSIQFNIINENDRVVLNMRFPSLCDKNDDIVYLMFKHELGKVGFEIGGIELDTNSKTLIANILHKSVSNILRKAQQDLRILDIILKKSENTVNEIKNYKEKLIQIQNNYHNEKIDIAKKHLKTLSDKYSVDFILTDESTESLKNFSGNTIRLEKIIEDAVNYAYILNSHNKSNFIIIEETYFNFIDSDLDLEKHKQETFIEQNKLTHEERTINMLNKIEIAVKKLLANNEKINGQNVGKAFVPSITAAAITDFLKKYSDHVNKIISEDPTKFPESKKYFKPVQNVIKERFTPSKTG